VIGAGRIGRVHTAHLAHRIPEVEIVAICDVVTAAAEKCAADFGIPTVEKDTRALLARGDVDAVVICSSTDTHAPLIVDAAAAGKHIFCEKPIALDLKVIDNAVEAARRAKVKLQIGYNRRFDSNYRRVWELIRQGTVGDVHIIHIMSRDPAPPPIAYVKRSGGIFFDMMIHDFDMARYLVGSEVREVFTLAAVRVDPEIGKAGDLDTAVVALRFENGAIGTIDNSRKAVYGYDQRVEVFGSKGMAQSGNNSPNNVIMSGAAAVSRDLPLNFFMERYLDSFLQEMREFITCVSTGAEPPVGGADGRASVRIGIAARKSHDEGRPVKMSEIG
jgi:myo-inositol 2-dehydrogenase/D-chiro-inositol 1-dehydrogenase